MARSQRLAVRANRDRAREVRRHPSINPYPNLSEQQLLKECAHFAREHPEELAAEAAELESWQAIPWENLPEEDWSAEIAAAQQRGGLDRAV